MADTTIKLSGTYDSIEAYELLEEMRGAASDYLPLTGGEISGDLIVDGQLSGNLTGNVTGTASGNLPLSGGTMTGTLTLSDGGTALSNATVGTIVDNNTSSAVSIPQGSATTVVSINLDKGNWVITGHAYFFSSNVTANKVYSIGIGTTANNFGYGDDGSMTIHASYSGNLVLQTTRILQIGSDNTTVYMCSLCNVATSISVGRIRAIRIS